MTDLSISLLCFNTKDLLKNCLLQIKKASRGLGVEILLVDNGSTDGASQMVKKEFPEVKLITSRKNLLYIKGHNLNLTRAAGKYFLILNEDTQFAPDTFRKLVDFMEKNPQAGLASCRQVDEKGKADITCSKFPTPIIEILESSLIVKTLLKLVKVRYFSKILEDFRYLNWDRSSNRQVDVLPGSLIIGRNSLFKKIGYFDQKLKFFYGEADLAQKTKEAGYRSYHIGNITITHLKSKALVKLPNFFRWQITEHDMLYYYKKYFGFFWFLVLLIFLKPNRLYYFAIAR